MTNISITGLGIVSINYYGTDIFILRNINEMELSSYKIL